MRLRACLLLAAVFATQSAAQRNYATAKVAAVESLSHNVKRVRLRMPRDYKFEAGQFALVRIPKSFVEAWNAKYKTSHREVARPYSFASSPKRLPLAEFIVQVASPPPKRDVPPGIASTYIHTELKPGDSLEVSDGIGSLAQTGAADTNRAIVLVAGGTGVAPLAGLLDHWFRTKSHKQRKVFLFFGARQRRDLILDAQFRRWAAKHSNFTYVPALSEPSPEDQWTGPTGFINAVLDKHFTGTLDADVLIAGSPRMMQETVKVTEAKGVPKSQIRHDPIQVAP